MNHPITADIIHLLRHLVVALQPFAQAQNVELRFESEMDRLSVPYNPEYLLPDLTQLLCRVVTVTPENHSVTLQASLLGSAGAFCLQLSVVNTGSNLARLTEITAKMRHPVHVKALEEKGTRFELRLPMERSLQAVEEEAAEPPDIGGSPLLKQFYAEMRKWLSSHFSDPVNLERAVNKQHPRDAVFLHKVNAVILAHLDRENFDVKQLCKSLALSRTQLYRRLVPIIRQPPAKYIRLVRLQKAKEMLEAGEMNIGEIATRTGFRSPSHFTRIFTEHYGVRPSAFRRQPKPKT